MNTYTARLEKLVHRQWYKILKKNCPYYTLLHCTWEIFSPSLLFRTGSAISLQFEHSNRPNIPRNKTMTMIWSLLILGFLCNRRALARRCSYQIAELQFGPTGEEFCVDQGFDDEATPMCSLQLNSPLNSMVTLAQCIAVIGKMTNARIVLVNRTGIAH